MFCSVKNNQARLLARSRLRSVWHAENVTSVSLWSGTGLVWSVWSLTQPKPTQPDSGFAAFGSFLVGTSGDWPDCMQRWIIDVCALISPASRPEPWIRLDRYHPHFWFSWQLLLECRLQRWSWIRQTLLAKELSSMKRTVCGEVVGQIRKPLVMVCSSLSGVRFTFSNLIAKER